MHRPLFLLLPSMKQILSALHTWAGGWSLCLRGVSIEREMGGVCLKWEGLLLATVRLVPPS